MQANYSCPITIKKKKSMAVKCFSDLEGFRVISNLNIIMQVQARKYLEYTIYNVYMSYGIIQFCFIFGGQFS